MSYWAAAQLQPQRDGLALHCLQQAGFETYAPRLREQRTAHGRKVVRTPLLFPGYLFVLIELQWHTARWCPGVVRIVLRGGAPAAVPEGVIMALKAREIQIPRRRPAASRQRPLHWARRSLRWDEAARARRGLARDPWCRAEGDAGRRFGGAGSVIRHPKIGTGIGTERTGMSGD